MNVVTANEILLPRTDAGAGAQVIFVVVAMIMAGVLVRRERALVTLVVGVGLVVLGLMGMRALH
jgi:hypothetical protein